MYPAAMTRDLNQSLLLLQNLTFPPEPVIRVTKSSWGRGAWSCILLMLTSFVSMYGCDGYSGVGFNKSGLVYGQINTASVNGLHLRNSI